jgi:hypothetical protein
LLCFHSLPGVPRSIVDLHIQRTSRDGLRFKSPDAPAVSVLAILAVLPT